jgi:hypothetical protein
MRGSPWFRTLIVAVALGLAAWGIAFLTAPRPRAVPAPEPSDESAAATTTEAPFFLTLSAEAREVVIEAGGEPRAGACLGYWRRGGAVPDLSAPTSSA